jgi:predicted DNA binding CopG/RHH family protein
MYVKSLSEYRSPSQFEKKKILDAAKRLKKRRKLPTSIALEDETVKELKVLAESRGVPYQILMRMFILEGLHNWRVNDAR